jgi:hypothetical protein
LVEKLSKLIVQDLEEVEGANKDHLNKNTQGLLKTIETSCKAMGHTEEAAKYVIRCCFAMLDNYRLKSLFLKQHLTMNAVLELDFMQSLVIG